MMARFGKNDNGKGTNFGDFYGHRTWVVISATSVIDDLVLYLCDSASVSSQDAGTMV